MYSVRLINQSHPFQEPLVLNVCNTFFSKFRGYMLKSSINPSEGLILVGNNESRPNSSIHMFFMLFTIAVVWMDAEKRVVDVQIAKPWRPYYAPRARALYTIETHPNRASDFSIGDHLDFE